MSDTGSIASLLTQTITANARSAANAKVEIVVLPQAFQNLEQAQTLRGQIVQIDQNGTITIRTDQGQVIIRTDQTVRLENGAPIEIRIDAGNPPAQALLRPAPQTQQQAPPQQERPALPQVSLPQTLSFADITNGATLEVTPYNITQELTRPFVQQIQSRVSPLAPINIALNESGGVITQPPLPETFILSLNTPFIPPTGEADLSLPPLGPQINAPFRTIAAQIISAPLQEPIIGTYTPTISQLSTIQIENIIPPAPSIAPDSGEEFALLNTRIGSTHGVLEGFTQNRNFAVFRITAPDGLTDEHYALHVPIEDIPVGSRISLNILQTSQSTAPALTAPYYLTPSLWPIFQEVEQSLTQVNPQAVQVFNAVLPNAAAPAQMGTSVMFFVAAMRAGDIQGWLGDKAVDAIKRAGKSDLLGRLGRELSGLARMNADSISGDWRGLSLPLAWQNDIHKVALYYRHEDDGHSPDEQGAGKKTRFIMDLNLSQMGKVQLDGIFTGQSESVGRLDLVLRTEQSFTQNMKQDMRTAYKGALKETQITGELSFQDHLDSWVRITPDEVKEYDKDV